jgi:hypothetical protein
MSFIATVMFSCHNLARGFGERQISGKWVTFSSLLVAVAAMSL